MEKEKINSVKELKELVKIFKIELAKDGHKKTSTNWIIEVILDSGEYDLSGLLVNLVDNETIWKLFNF